MHSQCGKPVILHPDPEVFLPFKVRSGRKAVARELGCAVNTVRTWRRRFARDGLPGLSDSGHELATAVLPTFLTSVRSSRARRPGPLT